MNIFYLASLHPNKHGSMEEHLFFLSCELKKRGHQCFLGLLSNPLPELSNLFEESGAHVITVNIGKNPLAEGNTFRHKLNEMLALRRIVIDNKIDLVHLNFLGVTELVLLGIYSTKAKIIFTDHSSGGIPRRNLFKQFISRSIHNLISRRISRYIAVSDFVRTRLKFTHHVSDRKTMTVYNGVNIDRFCPQDMKEVRQSLALPLNIPIISAVAMLIPEKGIQYLIEATSILINKKKQPLLRLLIVGEGSYRSQLEALCSTLKISSNVHFLGRINDVQNIIAASDIVVVPSIWEEAFGLIVAETMACGRPLVASFSGGIPELVEDVITGQIVPCKDSSKIAETIGHLLSDAPYRKQLGKHGRERALRKFNLSTQINQLVDIYEKVVN